MKVLYIVKTNYGAKWAYEEALELINLGNKISVILPEKSGGYAEDYKLLGINVYSCKCILGLNIFEVIKSAKCLKLIIAKENPDIIHTHFVNNTIFIRIFCRFLKIPRIFQVPGPLHLETWYTRAFEKILSNKYDFWGCGCKKTLQIYLRNGIDKNKLWLTYYGVGEKRSYNNYRNNTFILHNEYGIKKDLKIVAMVCYFYPPKKIIGQKTGIKGFEDFIDAMSILCKNRNDVIGMIIGDAFNKKDIWYVEKIKKYAQVKCNSKIIFTGFRKDLVNIYKEISIAVHPSHSENLGGAAESLAAAVPTISTNVGGFPDIVINNVTGITVEPENPFQLSKAIDWMLNNYDLSIKMAFEGQKLVNTMLDIRNTAAEINNFYNFILKQKIL